MHMSMAEYLGAVPSPGVWLQLPDSRDPALGSDEESSVWAPPAQMGILNWASNL